MLDHSNDPFISLRGQPLFRLFSMAQIVFGGLCGFGMGAFALLDANQRQLGFRLWSWRRLLTLAGFCAAAGWSFAYLAFLDRIAASMTSVWPDSRFGEASFLLAIAAGVLPPTLAAGLVTLSMMGGVLRSHASRRGRRGTFGQWLLAMMPPWALIAIFLLRLEPWFRFW